MDSSKLQELLQTNEGLKAVLTLLNSVYSDPEKISQVGLHSDVYDYSGYLRSLVSKVLYSLPTDNHLAVSYNVLCKLSQESADLSALQTYTSAVVEAEQRITLIKELKDRCEYLKSLLSN